MPDVKRAAPTAPTPAQPRYQLVNFEDLPAVDCPCGQSRRAFGDQADAPLTVHRTEIGPESQLHYHKQLSEIYYVLDCSHGAYLEVDGDRIPATRGTCILIPPGVRHRAVGPMTVLVIVSPKFDPGDEWFD